VLRRPDAAAGARTPRHARGSQAGETLPFGGRPLDTETRAFFEPRFGYDFSKVRIYPDERAAESAQSMGALAYTTGANIAFGGGRYQPHTGEGRRLLAHELTHVVQQGQAAADGQGVKVSAGRAARSIQRDTPRGDIDVNKIVGPLSITKEFTPDHKADQASRQEVTEALTDYLTEVQREQHGQTLHVTDRVKWAVRKLFQGDATRSASAEAFLSGAALPGSPAEFAAAVTKMLPDSIPRSHMAHLGTDSPKDIPDTGKQSAADVAGHAVVDSTVGPIVKKLPIPQSWKDKIMDGARGAVADGLLSGLDQAMSGSPLNAGQQGAIHAAVEALIKQKTGTPPDRQQDGAGSPYGPAQVEPPSTNPSMGSVSAPGEHIFNLPSIHFDFPGGQKLPKPILPEKAPASQSKSVEQIVQGLDDGSLIPAAAKGKANQGDFASAKDFARGVTDQLADADKKKQYTVEVFISTSYRHVDDLREIFDKMEDIVKKVAAALPGGAANVGEVIISPERMGKKDTIPARRVVRLHGGD
jgi:hypothetical protein